MHRRSSRVLLMVAAFVLFLVPVAAIAAGGFTDVEDDNVFLADIQWMKDNGITKGCNPPTNDRFCPGRNVTREQMSAFMHRLAANQVVDAATALEADNADTLDGKDSADFVEHGEIVMGADGHNWTVWGLNAPSDLENWMGFTRASADGSLGIGLSAPTSVGGVEYALESVEICIDVSSGAWIVSTDVYGATDSPTARLLRYDGTVRSSDGCYTVNVNRTAPYGAGIGVTLGGGAGEQVSLYGVRSTWIPMLDLPLMAADAGIADDRNG